MLALLISALLGCSRTPTLDSTALIGAAAGGMPEHTVRITGLVMHDWAYPRPERVGAETPLARYAARGEDGGPAWHGVLLRLDPGHEYAGRDRPGPLLLAFVPYAEERTVLRLKEGVQSREPMAITAAPLGVLSDEVWDGPVQNTYDPLPAFELLRLH